MRRTLVWWVTVVLLLVAPGCYRVPSSLGKPYPTTSCDGFYLRCGWV
jgi:hypothetical protein